MEPSELAKLITTPTDDVLNKISFPELYTQVELKAVMKIKLTFFRWFEDLIKSILKNNQKFLKKQQKKQETQSKKADDQSEDLINTSSALA